MNKQLSLIKKPTNRSILKLVNQQMTKLNSRIKFVWLDANTQEIVLLENFAFSPKDINLKTQDLNNFNIFPDLYWLNSKDLVKQLSILETKGITKQLQTKLEADEYFLQEFYLSVEDFKLRRKNSLAFRDLKLIEKFTLQEKFLNSGIAATKNILTIKCLHAQFAHYIASKGNNAIGKILIEQYGLPNINWLN